MIHGFVLAAGGGLIGALSVMFGKTIAELVKPAFTDGDGSAFARFETYLIIIAMCGTLFVQMLGLNHALQFHTAIFIVPIYQTFWIIGSIVGGGVSQLVALEYWLIIGLSCRFISTNSATSPRWVLSSLL